jgi:hypothetical protein
MTHPADSLSRMKNRAFVRVVVLAALFAWPAVESYRYYVARQQLAASEQLYATVTERVAQARVKHAPATKTVDSRTAR